MLCSEATGCSFWLRLQPALQVPVLEIISPLTMSGRTLFSCFQLQQHKQGLKKKKKKKYINPVYAEKTANKLSVMRAQPNSRMAVLECRCNHRGQEALRILCFSQTRALQRGDWQLLTPSIPHSAALAAPPAPLAAHFHLHWELGAVFLLNLSWSEFAS